MCPTRRVTDDRDIQQKAIQGAKKGLTAPKRPKMIIRAAAIRALFLKDADSPETRAVVKRWVDFYKRHRAILDSDIIHLRRADGRDLDYFLHVNPALPEKGLLMVYNPLDREVKRTLNVPLYYTGLTRKAVVREREGSRRSFTLTRDYSIELPVAIPARGVSWFVIQ